MREVSEKKEIIFESRPESSTQPDTSCGLSDSMPKPTHTRCSLSKNRLRPRCLLDLAFIRPFSALTLPASWPWTLQIHPPPRLNHSCGSVSVKKRMLRSVLSQCLGNQQDVESGCKVENFEAGTSIRQQRRKRIAPNFESARPNPVRK